MTEPEIPFVCELRREVRRTALDPTCRLGARSRRRWPSARPGLLTCRPLALTASALTIAGAVAVTVVLLVGASASTQPAYALTPHADGSYTLTINDLATAVPQVNAEFAKLGIRAKAIPVTASCPVHNSPLAPVDYGHGSMNQSITIDNADIPAGWTEFIAAEQTPSGAIKEAIGNTADPLPPCFSTKQPPLPIKILKQQR